MKTSILIIAHNEEAHIRECIESVLRQSQKADEILLIAHNCTDKTVDIAEEYPEVTLHILETSEKGPQYARKYGFEKSIGDIIACIDGDGVAKHDWLMEIIEPFKDKNIIAVGGRVWFYRSIMGNLSSLVFFMTSFPIIRTVFPFFFWGANFACRKSAYESIGGFERIISLQEKLGLNYPAEDALLSFALMEVGKIQFVSRAIVTVHMGSYFDNTNRGPRQREDNKKNTKIFWKVKYEKTTSLVTVVLKREGGYVHSGATKGSQYEAKHNSRRGVLRLAFTEVNDPTALLEIYCIQDIQSCFCGGDPVCS